MHMSDNSAKKLEKKIKKLKKEIDALKLVSARFLSIFNAIPDAAVFTDIDRRIVMVNNAVEKIFGYTREEVDGRKTE